MTTLHTLCESRSCQTSNDLIYFSKEQLMMKNVLSINYLITTLKSENGSTN